MRRMSSRTDGEDNQVKTISHLSHKRVQRYGGP